MFTGIAQELGTINKIIKTDVVSMEILCTPKLAQKLERGGSINIDGACLTIMKKAGDSFVITLIPETFDRTVFGSKKIGDKVHLESPLALGEPLVGGMVSGLVDGIGTITKVIKEANRFELVVEPPLELMKFIAPRTGVVLNGIGVNTKECSRKDFTVALYPYITAHTTLASVKKGDKLNLEVSSTARIIVHYLETQKNSAL